MPRMSKLLPLVVFLLAVPICAPAHAEPLVRLHTGYYYIDGQSAIVLAAQIDQLGPKGPDGVRSAARTKWDIQWKFNHAQQGVTCSIKNTAVAIGVARTLPRWRGESKGPAPLRAHWKQFHAALLRHEDRHKEFGLQAGREIESALIAMKPASNCEDLKIAANALANQILGKYKKLEVEFDRQTRHGRSEGASLL